MCRINVESYSCCRNRSQSTWVLYSVPNIQCDLSLCWAGKGVAVRWNVQTLQDPEFAFLEP